MGYFCALQKVKLHKNIPYFYCIFTTQRLTNQRFFITIIYRKVVRFSEIKHK